MLAWAVRMSGTAGSISVARVVSRLSRMRFRMMSWLYLVGGIEEVYEKAEKLAAKA